MLIDSSIAQAYIESSCVDAFRASWLFEHTSVSSDLGRNAFTPPPEDLALRETVRKSNAVSVKRLRTLSPSTARFGTRFSPIGKRYSRHLI